MKRRMVEKNSPQPDISRHDATSRISLLRF
jgi:hypothetical protein